MSCIIDIDGNSKIEPILFNKLPKLNIKEFLFNSLIGKIICINC